MLPFVLISGILVCVSLFAGNSLDWGPSDWTGMEIMDAIGKMLVPKQLLDDEYGYRKNITRGEFCNLCVSVMKAWEDDFNSVDIYIIRRFF